MRRVVVYGSSGAGKSALAAELARTLGVPHVEIDVLAFHPDDSPVAPDDLAQRFRDCIRSSGWVVEGMHRDEIAEALSKADTFVWLDLSRVVVATRLLRRSVRLLLRRGERHGRRMTPARFVRVELPFVRKTIKKHAARRSHAQKFAEHAAVGGLEVVHLRSSREARALVRSDGPKPQRAPQRCLAEDGDLVSGIDQATGDGEQGRDGSAGVVGDEQHNTWE